MRADRWARIAGAVVFIGGAIAILLPAITPLPDKSFADPIERTVVTRTETVASPDGTTSSRSQTTTEKTLSDPGFLNEAFGARAALIFLRLGLVAFAALLAAAFIQRLALARFFVKLGPGGVEMEPLTEASATLEERLTALEENATKAREALGRLARKA